MKTALYARVSTDEEAEDNNIESQVAALRNHARAKDYEVISEFQGDGVSGATYLKDRPGGKVLLKRG